MNNLNQFFSKPLIITLASVMVLALGIRIWGQEAPVERVGLVEDWSSHHVIFSNAGTALQAIAEGRLEQWHRTVNDPRYIMQQLKRTHVSTEATDDRQDWTAPLSLPTSSTLDPEAERKKAPAPHRDWAFSLGGGTVAENMYPAKYTFDVNATPSCTSDFAVYGLNVAGVTTGQANLVALNELYSGTGTSFCGQTGPSVYWAYNVTTKTGGTITTSPVLSYDGKEVIFVESSSSGSVLHILRWSSADGGTVSSAKAPAQSQTSFTACTGTTSCLVSIALGSTSSNTTTNSSPFYDYADDTAYVGDDDGYLYKVTPVLGTGTPIVTKLDLVSSGGADSQVMTGPTYDSSSGYVFVGASNGELYAVTATTFSAVAGSFQLGDSSCSGGYNRRLTDAPVVDSTNGWVYEYVTSDNANDNTVVEQMSTAGPLTTRNAVTVGQGDDGCDSSTFFPTHTIAFDNNYYAGTTGSGGTIEYGHIWVCGRQTGGNSPAELWEIPTSANNGTSGHYFGSISGVNAVANSAQIQDSDSHEQCSPFTELENGTTDFLFFGEGLSGSFGYLYGFTLNDGSSTTEAATEISGSPITTYPAATGGTSAVVIDNVSSDAQASSIYFTTQAKSTTVCGSTSAYCAIKLTQSQLK